MNHYTIDILKPDFNYVLEAIRMRGHAIADQMAAQAVRIEQAIAKEEADRKAALDAVKNWTVIAQDQAAPKTAKKSGRRKGKKAPLVRTPEAPWGLKKDGSPRKRPGRPIVPQAETLQ